MKKLNNNFKYGLIKVVAFITIFLASTNLNNNKEENSTQITYSDDLDIKRFIDNFLLESNYNNLQLLNGNGIVLKNKNSSSNIRISNDKIIVDTVYYNGFTDTKILNIDNKDYRIFLELEKEILSKQYINNKYYDENGNINNLGKEFIIMNAFNINQEQLDFVLAGPMAEGIEDNYRDVSAAMRTGINRFFSYVWVDHAINNLELECDFKNVTIYDIFRDPYQFAVYYPTSKPPRYEKFLGVKEGEGYQGALDTLFYSIFGNNIPEDLEDKIVIHDYLEFQDKDAPIPRGYSYEQFVDGGNKHYRHQKEADIVDIYDSSLITFFEDYLDNGEVLGLRIK